MMKGVEESVPIPEKSKVAMKNLPTANQKKITNMKRPSTKTTLKR